MRLNDHAINLSANRGCFRTHVALGVLIVSGTIVYILGIGLRSDHPFGTDEAYSIWAAAKAGPAAIVAIPVLWDPGKQIFYYIVLHYFTRLWGDSEVAARSLSLLFALGALWLLYALAHDLFNAEAGVVALAIWMLNPIAVVFAWQARCYSMFLFIGLAQMISLWRLRASPTLSRTALCGILTAALLYTHMGGVLLLGGEAALLTRDLVRGRHTPQVWVAIGIAALLFAPYLPIALMQSRQLISGHWLDWTGDGNYALGTRIVAGVLAGAAGVLMVFGPSAEQGSDEPLRWAAAWSLLPILALLAGSIVIRPMFNLRYVTPSIAAVAILLAGALPAWGAKVRNLAVAGIAFGCLLVIPLDYPGPEPWPQLAKTIAAERRPAQPIFFESGFTPRDAAHATPNGGFPLGYYAVPFDYYFHGPNPQLTIPGYDPTEARAKIANGVRTSGGGWLISWKDRDATSELPNPLEFQATKIISQPPLAFYRIVPISSSGHDALVGGDTTRLTTTHSPK